MARGLKFRIWEVEGLQYLCSVNKGADQLHGYREADLRLCFRICQKPVFSRCGSNNLHENLCALYCRFGNVREDLIFANIREFVASQIQSSS